MARHWIAARPGGAEVFAFEEYAVPAPERGEVTIEVRAAGVNPADFKHVAGGDPAAFPEAANLLLAGSTAAEMLDVTRAARGETMLLHAASGAVGVSVLQQAARRGVRVVGTAREESFDRVRRFGGVPVRYGEGLEDRLREAAPEGFAAALDCVGSEEAVEVSLRLVGDRDRVVTIAAADRATAEGFRAIAGALPSSKAFRDAVRPELVRAAGEGWLEVPVARTYPLEDALAAMEALRGGHPGGKLALVP